MLSSAFNSASSVGGALLNAAAMALFAFILTLYLLLDGRRTYEWIVAYVPRTHRAKTDETLDGVTDAVKAARSEERRRMPVSEHEQETALRLVEDLKRAFAPLTAVFQDPSPQAASRLAEAHGAAAEALAKDRTGSSSHLWQGEAGEAMSVLLAELMGRRTGRAQTGGLRAFLSQPARGPRGPPAAAGASQALHLGTSRSPAAAARRGDPRQPQRGRLAPAAGGEPMAQPAHG